MSSKSGHGVEVDWDSVHRVRDRIAELEQELTALYDERRGIMAVMYADGDGMPQREIGAYFGISNPAVGYALGTAKKRGRKEEAGG